LAGFPGFGKSQNVRWQGFRGSESPKTVVGRLSGASEGHFYLIFLAKTTTAAGNIAKKLFGRTRSFAARTGTPADKSGGPGSKAVGIR